MLCGIYFALPPAWIRWCRGETEITGQTKTAYEIARAAGLTGPVLNRLFQKSFQVTKEIRERHNEVVEEIPCDVRNEVITLLSRRSFERFLLAPSVLGSST